jgi:hypothetical protein
MDDIPEIIDTAEIVRAIADLTTVTKYLGATKTPPPLVAAAMERLVRFSEKIAKKETI